jgi:lipopolysaccharide transport system permease protein
MAERSNIAAAGGEAAATERASNNGRDTTRGPSPPRVGFWARLVYLTDVTLHLARRDLALQHRGSVLGWLWGLVPPLLQLLVTYFVFTKVIPLDVDDYPVFLLTGILAWSWFVRSLSLGAVSLEQRRELVHRPGFPTIVLPVKTTLAGLLDYLLALPVLLVALAATSKLGATALFLPILLGLQMLLLVGLAWIVAPLQVFFRDVQHIVIVVITLGFWLTPIFYEQSMAPERFDVIYKLNPMAYLIGWQRDILLNGSLPSAGSVLALLAVVIGVAGVGYAVFRTLRDRVPEEL